MAKTALASVEEYIAAQPGAVRPLLRRVRDAIRGALPDAEEGISYGIPTYKMHGRAVIYFAGWKRHYSIYPASARLIAAFSDELSAFKVQKSTIRFPISENAPAGLIGRIAKFRLSETAARALAPGVKDQ